MRKFQHKVWDKDWWVEYHDEDNIIYYKRNEVHNLSGAPTSWGSLKGIEYMLKTKEIIEILPPYLYDWDMLYKATYG